MDAAVIWMACGAVFLFLEFLVPGGVISFLGLAAIVVGILQYTGVITNHVHAFTTFFIMSLVFILLLRSFFMKYFEGDSRVQNVDEDEDVVGSVVEVVEEILPHSEGRVKFRSSTWNARSDEALSVGVSAVIISRDDSTWIVKSI